MLFTLTVCGSPSETPPEVTVKLLPLSGQTFYFIGETVVALLWFFLTCTQTSLHPESLLSHLSHMTQLLASYHYVDHSMSTKA